MNLRKFWTLPFGCDPRRHLLETRSRIEDSEDLLNRRRRDSVPFDEITIRGEQGSPDLEYLP